MVRRTKTIRQEAAIRSLATGMAATHNTQSGATCLTAAPPRVTNSTSNGRGEENSQHQGAYGFRQGRKNKNDSIIIATLNARSLKLKKDELILKAQLHKPLIIGVTETWGNEKIDDANFKLDGYVMYRSDRIGRRGGGTILYIATKLGQRECAAMKRPVRGIPFENSTWCWVTPTRGKKILVGCIYRSTSSMGMNNDKLNDLLKQANDVAGGNRLLIMGDFNVPHVDWLNKITLPRARRLEKKFFGAVTDNLLCQHVIEPTRFMGEEKSTLDLIFTREEGDVKNIKVLPPVARSDHGIVIGEFICKWKSRIVPKKTPIYTRGRYDDIANGIEGTNWGELAINLSARELLQVYNGKYKVLTAENIPLGSPRDYNEPWMNRDIMKVWKKKVHSWDRVKERGSRGRWGEYRHHRDHVRKIIRKSRRTYEKNIAVNARHNKRAFFKYVNSRLTVRPEITAMKTVDNTIVEEDIDIVETMVSYFSTVHTDYRGEVMPVMQDMTDKRIRDIVVTPELVASKLEKLERFKSCGSDDIHSYVLKETAEAMATPLALIFQKSLDEGICPEEWKCANVTPIHKKGDRAEPSNYRPVSLTSQVCKVLESIVRDRIVQHLDENDLLNDAQHGFRAGRSCLTNLLDTLEQWTEIIDEGDSIDVAYLDFRKAFDLVSHEHLIYKLSKYGIKGQILNWIKDFLKDRTQRVVIRGTASSPRKVTSGVPQGSVLGPILFLIFINDLPIELLTKLSLFADDSKLFARILSNKRKLRNADGRKALQEDLDRVVEWAKRWKMEFNVEKCKVMHLGHNNPRNSYRMGDTVLEATEEEKDLGVLIDDKLDFGKHIRTIVAKANRVLGMIKVAFACMNMPMFLNLYTAQVRPLLEYCVQVWSPHKRVYIKLIEGVQRRATKLVPQLKEMNYDDRLEALGLQRLVDRRIRGDMIETYKIMTGKEKLDSRRLFTVATLMSRSHPMKIYRKYSRLDVRKYFFSQRVVKKWNMLSLDEVEAGKTSDFKAKYDKKEKERSAARENDIYVWE